MRSFDDLDRIFAEEKCGPGWRHGDMLFWPAAVLHALPVTPSASKCAPSKQTALAALTQSSTLRDARRWARA